MYDNFLIKGKASFVLGGQYGSEAKGSAVASIVTALAEKGQYFDIVTGNMGCQSGHTSIHNGVKRVLFHLPTAAIVMYDVWKARTGFKSDYPMIYLNAGCAIDPTVLQKELEETGFPLDQFFIHPNAAVVTQDCRDAEGRNDSAQTRIASTRKGVGEALSRKVLRSGQIASRHPYLAKFTRRIDLNKAMRDGQSVLVEVPQGISLSLNGPFYPHCTSRDCTVMQAMSDAAIHPSFMGGTCLVLRTFPIRVGNIEEKKYTFHGGDEKVQLGHSGGAYPDQRELDWTALGQTPEMTTVTKRQRRIFSFSKLQLQDAMASARPTHVFLAFCDYLKTDAELGGLRDDIIDAAESVGIPAPQVTLAYGPSTADVHQSDPLRKTPFSSQGKLPLNEFKA